VKSKWEINPVDGKSTGFVHQQVTKVGEVLKDEDSYCLKNSRNNCEYIRKKRNNSNVAARTIISLCKSSKCSQTMN
jgi:hypothetical protein